MDKAPNGIILISAGSNSRLADFPIDKLDHILSVLGSYEDVLVLMKFEAATLKERHIKNSIVGPWLPQQDILNHPKTKLFITLGGYLSIMEAVNYGKPVIAIPLEKSQNGLVRRVVQRGMGIHIDYDDLKPDILKNAIQEIYENPTFEENAKIYSKLFKESLMNPLEKISHIVNYTISSSKSLKEKKFNLNLPKLLMVEQDWFVIFIVFIFTLSLSPIILYKLIFKRKDKAVNRSNNKKKTKQNWKL